MSASKCDRECGAVMHMTGGRHRTDCAAYEEEPPFKPPLIAFCDVSGEHALTPAGRWLPLEGLEERLTNSLNAPSDVLRLCDQWNDALHAARTYLYIEHGIFTLPVPLEVLRAAGRDRARKGL